MTEYWHKILVAANNSPNKTKNKINLISPQNLKTIAEQPNSSVDRYQIQLYKIKWSIKKIFSHRTFYTEK